MVIVWIIVVLGLLLIGLISMRRQPIEMFFVEEQSSTCAVKPKQTADFIVRPQENDEMWSKHPLVHKGPILFTFIPPDIRPIQWAGSAAQINEPDTVCDKELDTVLAKLPDIPSKLMCMQEGQTRGATHIVYEKGVCYVGRKASPNIRKIECQDQVQQVPRLNDYWINIIS